MRNTEPRLPRPAAACGYTYVGLLLAVAMTGAALAATGQVWHAAMQHEKELELLFAGDEIRRAITLYHESTPGASKQFPRSLDDLLLDRRHPVVRRHLRKVYADPMTGRPEWGYIRGPGEVILGVHSLSTQAPRKRAGFPERYAGFEQAKTYADWRFVHGEPPAVAGR